MRLTDPTAVCSDYTTILREIAGIYLQTSFPAQLGLRPQ